MDDDRHVVSLDEVPTDGTLLFTVRGADGLEEVVLTRLGEAVVAYKNYCQHWTDVRLDKGSYLAAVDVEVRDNDVFLSADDYTFERLGPSGTRHPRHERLVRSSRVRLAGDDRTSTPVDAGRCRTVLSNYYCTLIDRTSRCSERPAPGRRRRQLGN